MNMQRQSLCFKSRMTAFPKSQASLMTALLFLTFGVNSGKKIHHFIR